MERALLRLALLSLLASSPAYAGGDDVAGLLDAARQAFTEGRCGEVRRLAKRARKAAGHAEDVLPSELLARVGYYEGLCDWARGSADDALDAWRRALAVDPDFQWDGLLDDEDAAAAFESIRREVQSRSRVDLGVPPDTGQTRIYVSGREVHAGDQVVPGRYLLQAACPDGEVRTRWWKFGKPPNYEALCPGGLGESTGEVVTGEEEPLFDEFGNPIEPGSSSATGSGLLLSIEPGEEAGPGEGGASTGHEGGGGELQASPAPGGQEPGGTAPGGQPAAPGSPEEEGAPAEEAGAEAEGPDSAAGEPGRASPASAAGEPGRASPADEGGASPAVAAGEASSGLPSPRHPALLYGGAGLLAAGAAMDILWVEPAWSEIEDARQHPQDVDRVAAAELSARFEAARWVTLGTLGLGLAGVAGGFLDGEGGLLVLPGGMLWSGRF